MKHQLEILKKRFKNIHVISWFLISLTILYVFLSILIEFQDWLMLIYGLMLIPLMFGLNLVVREEIPKPNTFDINLYNGLFAFFGVWMTYTLTHQLEISAVISSSFVGLMGHFLFRKHSVAMYCGSFAGMVSSFLFGYLEVGIIAVFCGLLFMLFKPVFKGMGGKLGTTAFLSTMLVASLLSKEFLIIDHELSFLRLGVVSVLGTTLTFYFQHGLKQSAVLASSAISLVFALVTIYIVKDYLLCNIVFFSASFVGMSSKERLPHIVYVILAGVIHAYLFFIYFDHYNGLGGKLGLMALTSVIMTLGFRVVFQWIERRYVIIKNRG